MEEAQEVAEANVRNDGDVANVLLRQQVLEHGEGPGHQPRQLQEKKYWEGRGEGEYMVRFGMIVP